MIPKFTQLIKPVLETCTDCTMTDSNAEIILAEKFSLSKIEKTILKPSGNERLFLNKIRWAKTHLEYAGLIKKTGKGRFAITTRGKEVLSLNPETITEKFLSRFDEYKQKRGLGIKFTRAFSMPNKWTSQMQPVSELLDEEMEGFTVDLFAGNCTLGDVTNDLNPDTLAQFHMEAEDFVQTFGNASIDTLIDDPPFTLEQISRSYSGIGSHATKLDTSLNFWSRYRKHIPRVVTLGGKVIKFGYDSCGYPGFTLERMLLLYHGGGHYDTICTVWRKVENV